MHCLGAAVLQSFNRARVRVEGGEWEGGDGDDGREKSGRRLLQETKYMEKTWSDTNTRQMTGQTTNSIHEKMNTAVLHNGKFGHSRTHDDLQLQLSWNAAMLIYNAGRTRPHEKQEGVIDNAGEEKRGREGRQGEQGINGMLLRILKCPHPSAPYSPWTRFGG